MKVYRLGARTSNYDDVTFILAATNEQNAVHRAWDIIRVLMPRFGYGEITQPIEIE